MGNQTRTGLRRVRQDIQACLLLLNNLNSSNGVGQSPLAGETPAGSQFDQYEARNAAQGTFILIYGLDLAGEKDPRLVKFGRACAAVGLRAVVPSLSGLKSYQLDANDLEILVDLILYLNQQYTQPIGMIGFSSGGSYALLASADVRVTGIVDPLVLFSPYYTLEDLRAVQITQPLDQPQSERDWEHYIWSKLALAYRNLERVNLSAVERAELTAFLANYCVETMPHKLEVYHRLLENLTIPGVEEIPVDHETLDRFSPCGKIGGIESRVVLFYDPTDYLIPAEHAYHIIDELQQNQKPGRQRMLITPLISHVSPRYRWRLKEIFLAIDMLGEIFVR